MPDGVPESFESPALASEPVDDLGSPGTSQNGFAAESTSPLADSTELVVGAAFVGGFLLGRLVKRLGS